MKDHTEEYTKASVRCAFNLIVIAIALMLAGCTDDAANAPSTLDPRGLGAALIADIWWFLLALGGAVFVAFAAYLAIALLRRRKPGDNARNQRNGARVVLFAGIIAPAIILTIVFGYTVATLSALSTPPIEEEFTVHVVAQQWWWEVRYPYQQIETANEIHIPVGEAVRFLLSSEDVIHSFWVPELQGKLDMVPGETNEIWLRADEPGVYIGQCAEFCGVQHAKMRFIVVAEPPEEFALWVAAQRQPAIQPTESLALRGQQVFLSSTCVRCHVVAGTHAIGDLGPDLTHIASRRTLAAATIENTIGNLGGWITDPQHIKPGALMPPTPLTGPELQALLAYLATLE